MNFVPHCICRWLQGGHHSGRWEFYTDRSRRSGSSPEHRGQGGRAGDTEGLLLGLPGCRGLYCPCVRQGQRAETFACDYSRGIVNSVHLTRPPVLWPPLFCSPVRCSTNAARRRWGTWRYFQTRCHTRTRPRWWKWGARVWRMQKKGTRPSCTVGLTETGWCPWAAASAASATPRWMATVGVRSLSAFLIVLEQNSEVKLRTHRRNRMKRRGEGRHRYNRSPGPPRSSAAVWISRAAIPSSRSKMLHPCLILSIFLHLFTSSARLLIIFSSLLSTLFCFTYTPVLLCPSASPRFFSFLILVLTLALSHHHPFLPSNPKQCG